MNVQQIEYVLAVNKLRNFGEAAKECFITQSTLSTMIARFESEIGIIIFDRKTKPVTITKEGEQVIRQLKVISKEMDNLNEVVNSLKGEIRGTLKIGAIPTVAPYLFPIFLNNLISKFPKVQFEISEIPTGKIMDGLVSRDLDVGIASIPLKDPEIVEIPLYNEPFLLFDKASEKLDEDFKVTEIDFNRLWLLEEGHCMRTQVEKICDFHKKRIVNGNLIYKSGTIGTLMKFVNKHNGVTLLPLLSTLDMARKQHKYLKKFKAPIPVRMIGLVVHRHFVKKSILEYLQKEIQSAVIPLIGKSKTSEDVIPPL